MKKPEVKIGHVGTLAQLATVAGVSLTALSNWRRQEGFPQAVDGEWNLWEIATWVAKRDFDRQLVSIKSEGVTDPLLTASNSPAAERYRAAKAQLAEFDVLERVHSVISREVAIEMLNRICLRFRHTGEQLQREFGPRAHKFMDECCDDIEQQIKDFVNSLSVQKLLGIEGLSDGDRSNGGTAKNTPGNLPGDDSLNQGWIEYSDEQ